MFERFTERARQVVVLAQHEARTLKHDYVGTEHILLGLLREQEGLAARVLESLNVDIEDVRAQVARVVGEGEEVTTGQIPFTPRAKKVLELSLREAISLGHNSIGTEHVLLGLARENEGLAARILLDFGIDAERLRNEVIRLLGGRAAVGGPTVFPEHEVTVGSERGRRVRFRPHPMPRRVATYGPGHRSPWEVLAPPLWAGFGLAIGILLGWLIWG